MLREKVAQWLRIIFRKRSGSGGLPSKDELWEEETLPGYDASQFYPVSIGDMFKNRYQVLGKFGYGGNSTVWFAKDHRYVSVVHSCEICLLTFAQRGQLQGPEDLCARQ